MIRLMVEPRVPPLSWEQFCKFPTYSIALDGFVHGGPRFDSAGRHVNFNHHEEVDRLATRATCAQVHLAIRQRLFDSFRDESGPRADVYVNDCDQDVCLSWYLIKNHFRAEPAMNALLNRLVFMEDMLDATAGAYPYPADLPALSELSWVFEPYTRARSLGLLDQRAPETFRGIIEDVSGRIDRHVLGKGDSIPLDTRYKVLRQEPGYVFIQELGSHARTGLFADGIRAFFAPRQRSDGRWSYTVGRMSTFVPFNIPLIFERLNEVEGLTENPDRWGGSTMVGGSPRVAGSKLDPDRIAAVLAAMKENPS